MDSIGQSCGMDQTSLCWSLEVQLPCTSVVYTTYTIYAFFHFYKITLNGCKVIIGVWIDTYVFYQSVLQKKTWIWSLCVAKT